MKFSLITAVTAAVLSAGAAQAAVIVNVQESGADVVIGYSGTIDLTGLGAPGSSFTQTGVYPNFGIVVNIDGTADYYNFAALSAPSHGPGGSILTTAGTGDAFGTSASELAVPVGYVSGTALSGSYTFVGASLLSLGYTPGSYVTLLPNDTITVNVGAIADVPVPAAAPLLLGALALTGFVARRRKG